MTSNNGEKSMSGSLQKKIDFAVVIRVTRANPNGDPLNGNRPRTDYNGFGEITDVCLKRKIRDRLLEAGHSIFVQSDDRKIDGARSLKERAESEEWGLGKAAFSFPKSQKKNKNKKEKESTAQKPQEEQHNSLAAEPSAKKEKTALAACRKWLDVRTFGNLFAWEGTPEYSAVSIGIRGPVTVQSAFSVEPVEPCVVSTQITKSVSGTGEGDGRTSDTMGMKHRVDKAVYRFFGSINPQLAEKTTFNDEDAKALKGALQKLFENDASSARPEGSMEVLKVIWWQHNCKAGQYSSATVHRSLTVKPDGEIEIAPLEGLTPDIITGV